MSKYIDAEKLTKFEEALADIIVSSQGLCTYEACKDMAKREAPFLITSLQQEQSEVDLEEEVKRWKDKHGVVGMDDLWLDFACHFWNKGYNAGKEKINESTR